MIMAIKSLVRVAIGLSLAIVAQGETFTGPTTGFQTRYDNDAFPFDQRGAHFQEIFPKEAFANLTADVVEIRGIALHGGWETIDARELRILMGTQAGEPRLADFSSSFGTLTAPAVEVLPKGDLHISGSSTTAVIPLATPYVYDRRAGNLFIDLVCKTSVSSGAGWVDWVYNNGTGPTYYTLLQTFPDLDYTPTWANGAIVMDLELTQVPEASVLSLGVIGCALLGLGMKMKCR
jgi:hypothetical protein